MLFGIVCSCVIVEEKIELYKGATVLFEISSTHTFIGELIFAVYLLLLHRLGPAPVRFI